VSGYKVPWGSGHTHGWSIGSCGGTGVPPNYSPGGDNRAFSCVTVRYPINLKKGWPDPPGDCANLGVCDNTANNIPINSAHPGGANVLLGDGSVRFVAETVTLETLARLATRDDGQSLTNF